MSVRFEIVEQVPQLAAACERYGSHIPALQDVMPHHLLPIVVQFLSDENTGVRKAAYSTVLTLVKQNLLSQALIEDCVCPTVLELSQQVNSQMDYSSNALMLMSKMAPLLGRETTERLFLQRFSELCANHLFYVRKFCASSIGEFCSIVSMEAYEGVLLPCFIKLCHDEKCFVRKACAEVAMSVSFACPPEARRTVLAPVFAELLEDESQLVKMSAFQTLGPFISTFADPSVTGVTGFSYNEMGEIVVSRPDGTELNLAVRKRNDISYSLMGEMPDDNILGRNKYKPVVRTYSDWLDMDNEDNSGAESSADIAGFIIPDLIQEVEVATSSEENNYDDDSYLGDLAEANKELVYKGAYEKNVSLLPDCVSAALEAGDSPSKRNCERNNPVTFDSEASAPTSSTSGLTFVSKTSRPRSSSSGITFHSEASAPRSSSSEITFHGEVSAPKSSPPGITVHSEVIASTSSSRRLLRSMLSDDHSYSTAIGKMVKTCQKRRFSKKTESHTSEVDDDNLDRFNQYQYWYVSPDLPLDPNLVNNLNVTEEQEVEEQNYEKNEDPSSVADRIRSFEALNTNKTANVPKAYSSGLIVPRLLVEYFVSMSSDMSVNQNTDNDLAYHCAYSLPAVALTLGRTNWRLLQETCELLATHMHYKVRKTVASSLHELALILGQELATKHLMPLLDGFVNDVDEVRIGVLQHLADFLKLINPEKRNLYLPRLADFLKLDNNGNWRFREELAMQLLQAVPLFEPVDVAKHITDLGKQLLCDKVAAVREAALVLLTELVRHLSKKANLTSCLLAELGEHFALSKRWVWRQAFALLCSKLMSSNALPPEVFVTIVLPHILDLSWDPVPNVRLAVARTIARDVITHEYFENNEQQKPLQAVLRRLQADKDWDVRECAIVVPK